MNEEYHNLKSKHLSSIVKKKKKRMGSLQFNSTFCYYNSRTTTAKKMVKLNGCCSFSSTSTIAGAGRKSRRRIRPAAVQVVTNPYPQESTQDTEDVENEGPPSVSLAFVHSVLLPDGTPDLHMRIATGGQKLRDIMLDTNIDLYGPYDKALSNCAGGGTCATCIVEVIQGKQLLNPRTDKENEKLKKKPKNWRLACQTTVGTPDSRGLVVIQQLPEWKAHEWAYDKTLPPEFQIQQQ
ncbi:Photosynthetic NDH subunit of subcomplex B 3, chloroplastic [Linum grandiflorum]